MADLILGVSDPSAPQNNSRYVTPGSTTGGVTNTVEARAQIRSPAGTYSALSVNILTYFGAGNTLTAALRVNGVQSALVVSCPAGVTGRFENLSDTVHVDEGDLVALRFQGSSAVYSNTSGPASINFEPDGSGPEVSYVGDSYLNQTGINERLFLRPLGSGSNSLSESVVEQRLLAPGLLSHLKLYVTTNAKAAASALTLRVNGVDSALTVAVPASTTGAFEDLVNSVAIASGDDISYALDLGNASGNFTVGQVSMRFSGSAGGYDMIAAPASAGTTVNAGTFYGRPLGAVAFSASAATYPLRFNADATLSNLRVEVGAAAAAGTLKIAVNGVPGNLTVSNGGLTGYFEDLVNEDAVLAGDDVTIQSVASGTQSFRYYGFTVTTGIPSVTVVPETGELVIDGGTPTLIVDEFVSTAPGALIITGGVPVPAGTETVPVPPGGLVLTGGSITVFAGIEIVPPTGALIITGSEPAIYTEFAAIASQSAILASGYVVPDALVSQSAILASGLVVPPVRVSQQAILISAFGVPCVTRWCQCWLFTRTDGVEFAFTSHDEPVSFLGRTFSPCNSLNPSATEAATDLGAVGNMELRGIIDDDTISDFDLYSGLFDGCRVEVWEVPWSNDGTTPVRLAAGRTGAVSQGRDGFSAEVLGLGAQMQQQAITQVVTPTCRFRFGDDRCKVDLGPLTEVGAVTGVSASASKRVFADAALGAGLFEADYFTLGVVTFTSGPNEGLRAEIKEFDAATGSFVLWTEMTAPITAGDAFLVTPGCDLFKATCRDKWSNLVNYGGFPDVPGDDATSETPDAKY